MCKYTCLDCKNYKPKETKVVGRRLEYGISIPVYDEIPEHCDEHPRYFKKWWKENGSKKREDCIQPKCIVLKDTIKELAEMKELTSEILIKLKENGI